MSLIIISRNNTSSHSDNSDLIRTALSNNPLDKIIMEGLGGNLLFEKRKVLAALPEEWKFDSESFYAKRRIYLRPSLGTLKLISYKENLNIPQNVLNGSSPNKWFAIKNGRYATQIDSELISEVLKTNSNDVVIVNIKPELQAHQDRIRVTSKGRVAGFRRLYSDIVEPDFDLNTFYLDKLEGSNSDNNSKGGNFKDWPQYTFVKTEVFTKFLQGSEIPVFFSTFLEKCASNKLTMQAINAGGNTFNLQTKTGLLNFSKSVFNAISTTHICSKYQYKNSRSDTDIAPTARLLGKVILGNNVTLGPKVVIVGPCVICDNTQIKDGAVVKSSIIGSNTCVPKNQFVNNSVLLRPKPDWKKLSCFAATASKQIAPSSIDLNLNSNKDDKNVFRIWPLFSYPGGIKRILDFAMAMIVLILFAPVLPFIVLAIKLNSPGPIFFKDKRQGLHGKEFKCLKFRSMRIDSDKLQDKLRTVNQLDGPQFKMDDDPRITAVGRFLRDTYLDEIPQFFNVLVGQMSVVGPRPSPKQENTLCPSWRNARLSTRPGITGLLQICRTRDPMKDFQEWIYYDIKYLRVISLKLDLWICWQTAKKLVAKFIRQF